MEAAHKQYFIRSLMDLANAAVEEKQRAKKAERETARERLIKRPRRNIVVELEPNYGRGKKSAPRKRRNSAEPFRRLARGPLQTGYQKWPEAAAV